MNASSQKIFMHYDPEIVCYSLTKEELSNIKNVSQNNWKDFSIACFCVGIPCSINAFSEAYKPGQFQVTLSFNLNLVFGILGVVLGIVFLITWLSTKSSIDEIIKGIKNKPKMEIIPQVSNIGKIEEDGAKETKS